MDWKETDKRLIEFGKEMVEGACNALKIDKEKWKKELEEMNKGKRGAQYKIPASLISIASAFYTFLPYRELAGLINSLFGKNFHYTSLQKRIKKESKDWIKKIIPKGMIFFKKDLKPDKYFIDSTGFSIIRKGNWKIIKFKEKNTRKWYKLHKLCNSKGEIVAFAVTEGDANDSSLFEDFIEHIPSGSIIYGDKAYFSRKNYNIAEKKGIIFHSPPKKNALPKFRGSKEFAEEVKLYKELGYEKWAESTGYKERFNKEYVFSRLKTIFGETIRAITLTGVAITLMNMITLCNKVI
jgi:hypothetical protein